LLIVQPNTYVIPIVFVDECGEIDKIQIHTPISFKLVFFFYGICSLILTLTRAK
jgi:hypothetical protein